MGDGDFPAEEHDPDHVKDQKQSALMLFNDHLFPKGGQGGHTQLDRLQAKGNADNGQTHEEAADNIAGGREKAAKDEPDQITE